MSTRRQSVSQNASILATATVVVFLAGCFSGSSKQLSNDEPSTLPTTSPYSIIYSSGQGKIRDVIDHSEQSRIKVAMSDGDLEMWLQVVRSMLGDLRFSESLSNFKVPGWDEVFFKTSPTYREPDDSRHYYILIVDVARQRSSGIVVIRVSRAEYGWAKTTRGFHTGIRLPIPHEVSSYGLQGPDEWSLLRYIGETSNVGSEYKIVPSGKTPYAEDLKKRLSP